MKCIKSIKTSNKGEIGDYLRTTDSDAEVKVKSGFWAYAPKTEYKTWMRGEAERSETPQSKEKKSKSKKQ
jgi:hypothetical protein